MTGSSTTDSPHRRASAGLDHIATVRTVADLARLLRALRRREARQRGGAELTYRELGARAGWRHTVVADYLSGKTLPPTDRFDTLVQLLGAGPTEQGVLATARDRVQDHCRGWRRPVPPPPPGGPPIPRQLPAAPVAVVGRADESAEITRLLTAARRSGGRVLGALTGPPGAGKSTVALQCAHQLSDSFPDGQLYADLAGHRSGPPAAVEALLVRLLRDLGAPAETLVTDVDSLAARFRSVLHRRRVLILLDNAAGSQQVRPLLPGSSCLVLVTSRCRMNGLVAHDGAYRWTVAELPIPAATAVLAESIGSERVTAEAAAAAELARRCGGLPVALRAAGARLADRPELTVTAFLAALAAATNPLDLLDGPDPKRPGVLRIALAGSYHGLPPAAARLLRLASLTAADHFDHGQAAALTGLDPEQTRAALSVLVAGSLLQREPDDRYRLNPVVRAYAAESARQSGLD